jgi:phosphoglucosamine mutase
MTQRKYFGTDGIRGRVGEGPITAEFAMKLGRAAGVVLGRDRENPRVLIGKDTRISGYMLEAALESGLAAAGAEVVLLGPMPTPGVAFLTRSQRASAGIVISASHNPFEDNGIKFFSAAGEKLDDALEAAIEAEIEQPFRSVDPKRLGRAMRLPGVRGRYIEFLKSRLDSSLEAIEGMHLAVDAAHGAAYSIAPMLFQELGFHVSAIGVSPNGFNINAGYGATDPTALRAEVARTGAELGIALDGDGDRLMMITRSGRLIDGDDAVYLLARHWENKGRLRGPVVGTVMTNLGIERALESLDIKFERAAVGDRHVHQRLKEVGGILGGEASGHVICCNKSSTGDGLVTALMLLEVIAETGLSLDRLIGGLHRFPQRTHNIRISQGARALVADARVQAALKQSESELGTRGRVILRASGTEPLVRVTVEAETLADLEPQLEALTAVVNAVAAAA